jgi:diguanylate cyclase (GGDEF)-like protein
MPEESGEETISQELEQACAEEPIHIIGTIQPHGFVVVADVRSSRILQVSSGIARHWAGLGESSRLLHEPLADWVDGLGADPAALLGSLPRVDPMALPLRPRIALGAAAAGRPVSVAGDFECVGHRADDVAILEWQPLGDSPDQLPSEMQGMVEMSCALVRLRDAHALEAFYRDCVREVARLCEFDRVMLYRFLPDWTGEVIAEQAAGQMQTRFLGLRFPASDIPSQARALYADSKIRVLADVLAAPDTLLPALLPGGEPLDQSHSLLRGFSEVHRTYLKNMGVRATMSLSIVCEGKLWGLIACHHYQPRIPPQHVRSTLRQVCELVAGVSAMRIETLAQLESAHDTVSLDQLLVRFHQAVLHEEDTRAVLVRLMPELLTAFQASAFGVRIGALCYVGGRTGSAAAEPEILHEVAALFGDTSLPTGAVQLTDLLTPSGAALVTLPEAAGLLAVQQAGVSLEICAFTRPEVVREVNWAGAPVKRAVTAQDGRVRLEPRRSFALWREQIAGTSRPWSAVEVDACGRLLNILSDAYRRHLHKTLEQELRWRAQHDHLTGLINRRSVEESLDQRMDAGHFESAVMLIDLDHFKMVNDTHGHAAGDRLLQELSRRLGSVIRPSDILSRVGGDEFLLLAEMPLPDPAAALAVADRLHRAVEQPFVVAGQMVRLGLSVGISIPPGHGTNSTDLMRRADLALYRAKRSAGTSTVIFDPIMEEGLLGAYELERDLQEAIGKNQLTLVFQPEIDLTTGRVIGLEALARWNHPDRGAIGPSVFIPIAERSDLIIQIGQWVMRTAIATQAAWRAQSMVTVPVAVNVSMAEVTSGKLVDHIGDRLNEFQMPPECIAVELTESVIMKDPRVAMSVLSGLRRLGIATAIDDFGTGYSSLSYLRQLPLNSLKVDQSFTADLTRDAHSRSLTQAIIRMAEALKMTTIAEGVETGAQLQWLRGHKCGVGQGYLFSQAVPAGAVHATTTQIEAAWGGLH